MITFIKEWANQIIVAVIIATIFEMLLPNGNNKKYIKMVIGIYVLFTLIQPIVTKLTGKELTISTFEYEKYFDENILETSSENFENNNSKLIKQAYIDNIKNDIQAKVEQKGYKVTNCNINVISNENEENYGAIENIILKIQKQEKLNESTSNVIEIEEVEVNINNKEVTEKANITDKEKKEIIEYLASEYSINSEKIIIN